MLPTVLRRKAVLSGHLPLRLARSRARLQGRQAGEGWGRRLTEAKPRQGGARGPPLTPERPGPRGGHHAA